MPSLRITAGGALGLGRRDVGFSDVDHSKGAFENGLLRVLEATLAPLVIGMHPTNVHRVLEKIEPAITGCRRREGADGDGLHRPRHTPR